MIAADFCASQDVKRSSFLRLYLDSVLTMLEPQIRRIKTDDADIEYGAYNKNSAVFPEGETYE